jgi:branched-chain amino acid transport system substrate-binding protein
MRRRTLLASAGALAAVNRFGTAKADTPGVTATEIKIGNTIPYSGNASSYGVVGRSHAAYFRRLNEQGGIGGRQINFISLDDGFLPSKTVEQTRRLVDRDGVAFMFAQLGTAPNTAVRNYLNQHKVPQLFVATGADKWGNYKEFPWTIGWIPSYRTEAHIYGKFILENRPEGKIGILFQNDDFGKDYIAGLKESLGDNYARMIIKEVSYEVTDPTVDSQAVSLKSAGVDILITAAISKFAAQMIRKIYDMGWRPLHIVSYVSSSVGAVLMPAGPERAIGLITAAYSKDPTDPAWKDDTGLNEWREFMAIISIARQNFAQRH